MRGPTSAKVNRMAREESAKAEVVIMPGPESAKENMSSAVSSGRGATMRGACMGDNAQRGGAVAEARGKEGRKAVRRV